MSYVIVAVILILATAVAAAPAASERTAGDLRLEMTVGRTSYSVGEPVLVSARAVNMTASPVTITTTGFTYDVLVRQRGALVWQWSHDKAATQMVRTQQLAPGAALTFSARWDQRDLQGRQVEMGSYEVSCAFLGQYRQMSGPTDVGPVRITISR
jgi:intracellular proteinase inhibitor BsuPI